jgi:hypothetical protein
MSNWRLFLWCLGATGIALTAGCSSVINSHRQKQPMMEAYLAGNNDQVRLVLDEKLKSVEDSGDEVMWQLEAGSFYFNLGNFKASVEAFKKAEKLIAEYDERAIVSMRDAAAEGSMAVTNLNALPYRGFCRDRIALAVFKSLGYLGQGDEEAFRAQLRRLRDEQKKVIDEYRKFVEAEDAEIKAAKEKNPEEAKKLEEDKNDADGKAKNQEFNEGMEQVRKVARRGYGNFLNPLAIFLSGLGSIRDDNYENARIDFERLYQAMPEILTIRQYYVTVLKAANREIPPELAAVAPFDFPLDRDCVYVIFANGRSAAFKQIAIYFPIMTAWPMCEYYPAPYATLRVAAGGKTYETATLADMDGILAQEFEERLPGMITRIVLSTAIKETASYAATYAVGQQNAVAGGAVFLASVAYRAAFNTADTRSWEMLPKEFQLTQLPLPADRRVAIDPDGSGAKAQTVELPAACRSAIIYVQAPSPGVFSYHVFGLNSK